MQNSSIKNDAQVIRGTQKNCNDCQKKFSIMVRQHQCKRCLKPVCSQCGNFRKQVYSPNFTLKDHRVCKSCKQSSSYITDSVKNQDLQFGQTRDTGKKWLKKMTIKPSTFGTDTTKHKVFTKQVFAGLWASYSFELREFVGMLTFKYQQQGIYDVVYNVYTTVISASPQYDFGQIIHLIIYVLCFCSSDKAPFIVLYLLEIKQNEKDFKSLAFNYLKALPFKNQLQKLEGYINYRLERYADSFMVNCLTIQCCKSLVTKIFEKKNIEELLIYCATHIFVNRQLLVSKITQSKSYLDNLMLRNCKLEQLTSTYKYFKGKNFLTSFNQSQDLQQLSLRKMKTLNFERQYSPKSQIYQTVNEKSKPHLVSRSSIQYNDIENMEDSFSFYVQPDKQNTFKKSPSQVSIKSDKNILEDFQISPQHPKINATNQDSPFRKTIPQDAPIEQVLFPVFLQFIKPGRKNTDGPDNDRQSARTCERCPHFQEQANSILKKFNEEKAKWGQERQSLQQMNENMNSRIEKYMTQQFTAKSRINELQKANQQNQSILKQLQQKYHKVQEQKRKIQQMELRTRTQLKELNEKLSSETNDNIRLAASLQKQKRNVKEAREMCIQANKVGEALKLKMIDLEASQKEFQKNQASLKSIVSTKQKQIIGYKQKISDLQLKQASVMKKQTDSNEMQAYYAEIKTKNQQLGKIIMLKDKKLSDLTTKLEGKDESFNQLNLRLQTVQNAKVIAQTMSNAKTAEIQKLKEQMQTFVSQNMSLKQQNKLINTKNEQNIIQLSKFNQIIVDNKKQQDIKSMDLLSMQSQIANLNELVTQKTNQNQVVKRQNNQTNINLIQAKLQLKKIKDELTNLRTDKQLSEQQAKNEIRQLSEKLSQSIEQIQVVKKQKLQLQEQHKINLQKDIERSSQVDFQLSNQDHSSSSNSINTKQSEIINMLTQLNQRQKKAIQQLTASLLSMESANKQLNQRIHPLTQDNRHSHSVIENLQKEVDLLRDKNKIVNINYEKIALEISMIKKQKITAKLQNQKHENVEIMQLKKSLENALLKNQELLAKFSNISELMMQIEQEKMDLADELFGMHEFLKSKGILIPK